MKKRYYFVWPELAKFKCPVCAGDIPNFDVKIGFDRGWKQQSFECPHCREKLRVAATYAWGVVIGSLAAAAVVIRFMHIPSFPLRIPAFVAAWLVVLMLISPYVRILFPPKIRRYYPKDLTMHLSGR